MNTTFTSFFYLVKPQPVAKMLRHSNEKPAFLYFKLLLVARLWYIILTGPPPLPFPSIQSISTKYGLVLQATLIRGGGGDHKHKIMDRSFKQKWGTVSQVFLQLIVALWKRKGFNWLCTYQCKPRWGGGGGECGQGVGNWQILKFFDQIPQGGKWKVNQKCQKTPPQGEKSKQTIL